jgi:hypothetical protein
MPRTFYAFEHHYGGDTIDPRGRNIGQVYRFTTQAARDRWVSQGPKRFTDPRYREPISATSREVRSATRADYWTVINGDVEATQLSG